jgi:hypothetical protein
MTLLPFLKMIRLALYSQYMAGCPWQYNQTKMRNVVMLMVTISTVHQTVFVIFLAYLSKGWMLTTEGQNAFGFVDLDSNESAVLSTIVGGIYVSYSSLYLTLDSKWGQIIINLILNSLYCGLFYMLLKNVSKSN